MFAFNQLPPGFLDFSPRFSIPRWRLLWTRENPYLCSMQFFIFFFYSRIVILFASNDPTLMRDLSSMFDEFFSCCAFIFLRDWFLTFWEEGRGGGFCCETAIIAILLHLHKFNIFRTLILFFRRTIDLSNRLINEFWAWNSEGRN